MSRGSAGSVHAAAQPCRGERRVSRIKIFIVIFALRCELDLLVSSFRILEDLAFIIPDHDLLVVVIKHVTGVDGHLAAAARRDRKSTRLNSSHMSISYAVFC